MHIKITAHKARKKHFAYPLLRSTRNPFLHGNISLSAMAVIKRGKRLASDDDVDFQIQNRGGDAIQDGQTRGKINSPAPSLSSKKLTRRRQ